MVMIRRNFLAAGASALVAAGLPLEGASAQTAPSSLKITMSDGVKLAVTREGAGPTLLLVHGASGSHRSFARIVPLLAPTFTTYALDRRGYGDSEGAGAHTLAREAQDIAQVIDSLPAPVYVLAHSSGAVETLEALRLTGKARGVILYEPPLTVVGASQPEPVCDLVNAGKPEDALLKFYRDYVRLPPAVIAGMQARPQWSAEVASAPALCHELQALRGYVFDPSRFAGLHLPTLFLLGDQSPPCKHPA
jgi:pimeloyl-ACP methyl ester carboxylesterase